MNRWPFNTTTPTDDLEMYAFPGSDIIDDTMKIPRAVRILSNEIGILQQTGTALNYPIQEGLITDIVETNTTLGLRMEDRPLLKGTDGVVVAFMLGCTHILKGFGPVENPEDVSQVRGMQVKLMEARVWLGNAVTYVERNPVIEPILDDCKKVGILFLVWALGIIGTCIGAYAFIHTYLGLGKKGGMVVFSCGLCVLFVAGAYFRSIQRTIGHLCRNLRYMWVRSLQVGFLSKFG